MRLPAPEEKALWTRYREHGELQALHKIIISYQPLVYKIANQYRLWVTDKRDLHQEGNIGLLMAARKYDPEKGIFNTYASYWIAVYMKSFIIKSRMINCAVTNELQRVFFNISGVCAKLGFYNNTLQDWQIEKVSELLQVPEKIVRMVKNITNQLSLNDKLSEDQEELQELLVCSKPLQDDELFLVERRELLNKLLTEFLSTMNEKASKIFVEKLSGRGAPDVAKEYGVSHTRVQNIERKYIKKLRDFLQEHKDALET